mgnify:CR=1
IGAGADADAILIIYIKNKINWNDIKI